MVAKGEKICQYNTPSSSCIFLSQLRGPECYGPECYGPQSFAPVEFPPPEAHHIHTYRACIISRANTSDYDVHSCVGVLRKKIVYHVKMCPMKMQLLEISQQPENCNCLVLASSRSVSICCLSVCCCCCCYHGCFFAEVAVVTAVIVGSRRAGLK